MTGSEQSFAALYLDTRPEWSQRIRQAKKHVTMGRSSRAVAGARDERSAQLWMSDFGRRFEDAVDVSQATLVPHHAIATEKRCKRKFLARVQRGQRRLYYSEAAGGDRAAAVNGGQVSQDMDSRHSVATPR